MITTIIIGLVLLAGLAAVLFGGGKPVGGAGPNQSWWTFRKAGAVLLAVGLLAGLGVTFTPVGTSDTGVEVTYGHTVGDLAPGPHFVWPWVSITTWDGSTQQTGWRGKDDCLEIRVADQQPACLDVTVYWSDIRAASDTQFRQYRTFARLQNALVSRAALTQYFNNVFENYDPVAQASLTAAGKTSGTTTSTLTATVSRNIGGAKLYAGQLRIRVTSGQIRYTNQIDTALGRVIQAKVATNVATQGVATATQQNLANSKYRAADLTPGALYLDCLNITQAVIKDTGRQPSLTWSCSNPSALAQQLALSTTGGKR